MLLHVHGRSATLQIQPNPNQTRFLESAANPPGVDIEIQPVRHYPAGSLEDPQNVVGYVQAQAMVQVLKQCGDNLTRENVMRQAASLKDLQLPLALPGIKVNTSANDFAPFQQEQMIRFDGKEWVRFGEIVSQ